MVLETIQPEDLARYFHATYEAFAPSFGYRTRQASAVAWEEVPDHNKRLMIAVCQRVLALLRDEVPVVQAPQCGYCGQSPLNACRICLVDLCPDHTVAVEDSLYCAKHDPRVLTPFIERYAALMQAAPVRSATQQAARDILAALYTVSPSTTVLDYWNEAAQARAEAEARNDAPAYLYHDERTGVYRQFLADAVNL